MEMEMNWHLYEDFPILITILIAFISFRWSVAQYVLYINMIDSCK